MFHRFLGHYHFVPSARHDETRDRDLFIEFLIQDSSVLEPKFVYKIEQQTPGFRQQFWSR
jgi:hypothetical protein